MAATGNAIVRVFRSLIWAVFGGVGGGRAAPEGAGRLRPSRAGYGEQTVVRARVRRPF